jgi:hypothetical protein
VLTLVVEEHIVRDLEHIFSAKSVGRMMEDEVYSIASEPESLKLERLLYPDNLSRLEDGHRLLRNEIGNRDGKKEAALTVNDVSRRF